MTEALTVTVTVGQTGDFAAVTGPAPVRFGVGEAAAELNVAIVDDAVKEFEGGSVTATLAADVGVVRAGGGCERRGACIGTTTRACG